MANINEAITAKNGRVNSERVEWALARPWPWLIAGLGLTLWSLLWTLVFEAQASDYRVIVLAGGLLAGGVGLWIRWSDRRQSYLRAWRAPIALLLGCFFALACLGVTLLFGVALWSTLPNSSISAPGLNAAPLFLVWLSSAPPCFIAARHCFGVRPEDAAERDVELEIGLAFVVVAAICLLASFTLSADLKNHPSDWDTMRLFVRVCSAVSLYAAALTLASVGWRRAMLSLLFTLHFCAINASALSAPPAPWIVQQAWMRFFRPYVQFVYLINAYHFYAPDPGPASYVWFRLIYESPDKSTEYGMWYKIPQIDDEGHIGHPVALDYQRYLSLTENVTRGETPPPEAYFFNPITQRYEGTATFYVNRLNLDPRIPIKPLIIGEERSKRSDPRIPLAANMANTQQVFFPNGESRRLLASYARCVALKFPHPPEPERRDWKFKSVKIYRVVHSIPPVQWFLVKVPPTDPELYHPTYVGNYDAEGKHLDVDEQGRLKPDGDPYVYWLLPSVRKNGNDPDSVIYDYARLHAGDPKWIRNSKKVWVEHDEE